MSSAATAMGWPEQIVDAARTQMRAIAETHVKLMDQMTDAWEEQLKLPNPMTASPSAILSRMQSLPGFAPTPGLPSGEMQTATLHPLQFWMQFAEQWQKSWAQAMTSWGSSKKPD